MFLRRATFLFFCISLLGVEVFSQIPDLEERAPQDRRGSSILDDSTKQVYGPTTSRFTYLKNIKYNLPHYWTIDTTIHNWHRFQYPPRYEYGYHDLGNIGTAINPVFPQTPEVIGASSGFTLYDLYATDPNDVKYYDTKSPYSNFKIIWGGKGRSVTHANYTRNIDERSNMFFDYRGMFIDKQIGRQGRGDRNVQGINYRMGGNYATKNLRYQLYGNFTRNRQAVSESGGVFVDDENDLAAFFDDSRRQPNLPDAETSELRTNYQLYHQYKIKEGLQVYHEYNRYKQQNDFPVVQTNDVFFDSAVDSISTLDRSKIVYRQNEFGVKGDWGKSFYNFYYKVKDINFDYAYLSPDSVETDLLENYVGVNLRFGNDSVSYIEAYGEYLLDGNFRLGGSIRNSWFEAEGSTSLTQPTFMQRGYRGRYDEWLNSDFDDPITTSVKGKLLLNYGPFSIQPAASYTLLNNYIYFEDKSTSEARNISPTQVSSEISILTGEVRLSVDFLRHMNFSAEAVYTNVSGGSAQAVQVPDLLTNAQVYYTRISFNGNLQWQLGVDAHWKTAYFADGYDPAIMQFFVQDASEIPEYPIIDVFFNAKMNRGRFFLKYNNLYEIANGTGYFATPGYPGQGPIFDFGFDWTFYD